MREPLKDRIRLEHIETSIDNIFQYMEGKDLQQLSTDSMLFYAVVKNIEMIGEAAYRLSKPFCNAHPETHWNDIMRMRNVLVHDYFRINVKEIWKVVREDLQTLHDQVIQYIENVDWEEWEKNENVVIETAVHKNLVQTAKRMKNDGMSIKQISRYTGLRAEEIESL